MKVEYDAALAEEGSETEEGKPTKNYNDAVELTRLADERF